MAQDITLALTARLTSKLQAGLGAGFRAKLEVDHRVAATAATPPAIVQTSNSFASAGPSVYQHFAANTTPGTDRVLIWIGLWRQLSSSPQSPNDGETWEAVDTAHFYDDHDSPDPCEVTAYKARITLAEQDHLLRGSTGGGGTGVLIRAVMWELSNADYDSITSISLADQAAAGGVQDVGSLGVLSEGNLALGCWGNGDDGFHVMSMDPRQWSPDLFACRDESGGAVDTFYGEGFPVGWWGHVFGDGLTSIEARVDYSFSHTWGGLAVVVGPGAGGAGVAAHTDTATYRVVDLDLDRSRKMAAAQLNATLPNEAGVLGWYTGTGLVVPNNPCRAFVTYGDPDVTEWVQVFTGMLDMHAEHRDPQTVALKARSRMKWLAEQEFVAIASQDATDTTAIRTEANGVYLSKSPEYIVGDILDRAGWPAADRDLATSGVTIDEYDLSDGTSWAEQIVGSDRLAVAAGFDLWEDELGVIHFRANALADVSQPDPDYTFRAGVDVLALDHQADDEDLATRVTASGPMTSAVPIWQQVWATSILRRPVGMMYVAAESAYIYAIDAGTQYLSKIRQSDRKVVAHWSLGATITYRPGGLTVDEAAGYFYVLDGDWPLGGTTHAKVQKYNLATKAHVATYSLPDGQWSAIKTDGSFLWLTNYGDDKLYRRTLTATSSANYSYAGKTQPTGLYVDGTTLGIKFTNVAGFTLVDTSAPGAITGTQSTKGTHIFGGEKDTTTHTDLYVDFYSSSAGSIEKYDLVDDVTTDVVETAIDYDLEDALGVQSGIADRTHDGCPNIVGAHPFEIRPATYAMKVVYSTAQAIAVAEAQLALLKRIRRVLDLGTLGNPAIQINDVLRYVDPVAGIDLVWLCDSYRASLRAVYVTSLSALPWEAAS